ncbi:CocE/NonD family hydrolase [Streptomyces albospinus]|uniref:CocE/NonD family hydrolase n=1 Tax=Streptomyces albospinus TaxID=285515 RepID=UPI001E2D4073|nr:CocE/NonD family hydrolase [Streptomyces albospinus]
MNGRVGGGRPPRASRWMRAAWRKVPAGRYTVGCERGLVAPAADGSPLLTDHYFPCAQGEFPTLLVRSPYGRGLPWSPLYGILFAEQGFHVVVQSCRGTGGSGGAFHLWRNEAADGRAAVAWLREQPWFTGVLGTIGPSYLGYTQWALAAEPPPELRAMVVQVGLHDPAAYFHGGGAFHLENALVTGIGMTYQHRGTVPFLRAALRLGRGLRGADASSVAGLMGEVPWLAEVSAHPDADDPYWRGASMAAVAERLTVPTALITGWHDVLAGQALAQFGRLRRAGCDTALLAGPWTHHSALQQGWPEVFAESLGWLRAHLCGDRSGLRPTRVRVHVGGEREAWRDLADWPPAPDRVNSWFPAPGGRLVRQAPAGSVPPASFRYDPAAPPPSLGGPLVSRGAGPRDNRALEAREDVLTFTGEPLTGPVDVLGPVAARLRLTVEGGGPADVFARLCDVDAQGRSVNVCDGLVRLRDVGEAAEAGREPVEITVPMGSTAHRFAAGHRVRMQVSGGAYPRYAPDPGAGPVRVTVHNGSALTVS